jgi:hypothetical protein
VSLRAVSAFDRTRVRSDCGEGTIDASLVLSEGAPGKSSDRTFTRDAAAVLSFMTPVLSDYGAVLSDCLRHNVVAYLASCDCGARIGIVSAVIWDYGRRKRVASLVSSDYGARIGILSAVSWDCGLRVGDACAFFPHCGVSMRMHPVST